MTMLFVNKLMQYSKGLISFQPATLVEKQSPHKNQRWCRTMTTETLIQKVRDELGELDAQSEQAVTTAVKILQRVNTVPSPQPSEENFIGRNITLEEYKTFPRGEKRRYHDEAEELNWPWIENQLKMLGAQWIWVVDGQVVKSGPTLDEFPNRDELLRVCEKTGKYPFAFFSKSIFAIEELSTTWHNTPEAGDAYPALSIKLSGNNKNFETANERNLCR